MALKATIFKAALQIADMNRNYYHDHALTIARHPSETDERMIMVVGADHDGHQIGRAPCGEREEESVITV